MDDVQHGVALSCAEVVDVGACGLRFLFYGFQMSNRQIDDVDVVAHACAVWGGVVVAEYGELFEFACGDLADVGQ